MGEVDAAEVQRRSADLAAAAASLQRFAPGSEAKVGFSVGVALPLQLRVANIPPTAALNPRGGTDYPLTPAETEWQRGLFGTA